MRLFILDLSCLDTICAAEAGRFLTSTALMSRIAAAVTLKANGKLQKHTSHKEVDSTMEKVST